MADASVSISGRVKSFITICALVAIVFNWWPTLDALAENYLSDTIQSNLIVFGVVRSLNGVISVVQSAEVGVGVAGVGLGEIFDPVNDLVERFSGLLLVTLTALGVQQVILLFTTSVILKWMFTGIVVITVILLWWRPYMFAFALRVALVCILLRFLLSAQVGLIWLFDQLYFNATGAEALSILEASAQVIQTIKDSITDIDIRELIFGSDAPTLETEDIGTRLSSSVITLIVGMLFKSLLIPIGTVWAGYKGARFALVGRS